MIDMKSAVYTAPSVAARIFEFRNDGDTPPHVTVENLDAVASAAVKYQESDDGTTWTDIAGSPVTIPPGDADAQSVVSLKSRIACHAGGNVKVSVSVKRQANGAPTNLGPIL